MKFMADEIDLDLLDEDINKNNKVEERIKSLSEKVRTAATERDEQIKLSQEKDAKLANAEKEIAFFSSFSDSLTKYPNASEYKDAIKEKVLGGYSVEDATVAVLAREGKLSTAAPQTYTPPTTSSPAGGSSVNSPMSGGSINKPIRDMSKDEMRQALRDAEGRGDISMS